MVLTTAETMIHSHQPPRAPSQYHSLPLSSGRMPTSSKVGLDMLQSGVTHAGKSGVTRAKSGDQGGVRAGGSITSPTMSQADVIALKPLSPAVQMLSRLGAGAVAGVIGVCSTYPLDFAKTRLQKQVTREYAGVFDCLRKVRAASGMGAWYSGLRPNLAGIIPEKAIKLAANDQLRHMLRDENGNVSIINELIAGAGAGFCQVVVTTPMEIVKIRCQLTGASMGSVISQLGVRGLYKGYVSTLGRDMWFSVWFFPMQAKLKEHFVHEDDSEGERIFKSFGAGVSAGCISAAISTPMDVIKTRLQASDGGSIPGVVRDTIRKEGFGAFMKGWQPRCIAIAPLFGIAIMVYDIQKRIVRSLGYDPGK